MTLVDIINAVNTQLKAMDMELGGKYELIPPDSSHFETREGPDPHFEVKDHPDEATVTYDGWLGVYTTKRDLYPITDKRILEKVCQIARDIGGPTLKAWFYGNGINIHTFSLHHTVSPDQLEGEVSAIKGFYEGLNQRMIVSSRYSGA